MSWDAIKHIIGELEEITIKAGSFLLLAITLWQMIRNKVKKGKRRKSPLLSAVHPAKSSRSNLRNRRLSNGGG